METYKWVVVPIGNGKITEEIGFHPGEPVLKYQAGDYLNDNESPTDSLATGDKI